MSRAIQLAETAFGNTYPNPMVGAVIVHLDKIIGEGYHTQAGKPHAEVNAINSVKDHTLLPESTIYVTLEPCAHHGKTPPCVDLIIEKKIPKIVIATKDPFEKVAGKSIQKLLSLNKDVKVGIMEKESIELNKRFFTFHLKKRPYIILKWAQTLDGYIDIQRTDNFNLADNWITCEYAKNLVHKWRTQETAIMIGTNTAQNDNPKLNVRQWTGNDPCRIIFDQKQRLAKTLNIFNDNIQTIILTEEENYDPHNNNNIQIKLINFKKNIILQTLDVLHKCNIQSLIVEGGAKLINSFLQQNMWDEARILIGDKLFYNGLKAPEINKKLDDKHLINTTQVLYYKNSF